MIVSESLRKALRNQHILNIRDDSIIISAIMSLRLHFLGSPRIERDGRFVETDTRKAVALLAYLALTRSYQTREVLAALLWPEMNEERARAGLRRTLSALRAAVGDEALYVTR